jgi:hypothetical protein
VGSGFSFGKDRFFGWSRFPRGCLRIPLGSVPRFFLLASFSGSDKFHFLRTVAATGIDLHEARR